MRDDGTRESFNLSLGDAVRDQGERQGQERGRTKA